MTAAARLVPSYDDALDAVKDAQDLANSTGWPHAVIARGKYYQVVVDRCGVLTPVLERCRPVTQYGEGYVID